MRDEMVRLAMGAVVPTPTLELSASMVRMGVPVAALVAKENALIKLGRVAVAVLWNASVVVAEDEEPKVRIFELKYASPFKENATEGEAVAMPVHPWEVTMNLVDEALLNLRKLPVKRPLVLERFVVVAKSMRRPVPSKVPVAWVRERRETSLLVEGRDEVEILKSMAMGPWEYMPPWPTVRPPWAKRLLLN